jgi:adenosine kinase
VLIAFGSAREETMNILLTGSVAFDYLMTFPGYFRDHILPERLESLSLSFLVDSMTRQRGGIAPNIAYTLALFGERPRLWATVGEDFEEYRAYLESKGIDASGARVIPGVFTASFFVNTDKANSQIASFYPGAMGYAAQLSLTELDKQRPDVVVISPNDPGAMHLYVEECGSMGIPYFYDPSQQIVRMTGEELAHGISKAQALFVNDYEYALVQKMTGLTAEDVLAHHPNAFVVVTRGEKGASIYTRLGCEEIPVAPATQILDPTGVGDAFRGGFLTGYSRGLPMHVSGRMGALAATYCLEQRGPQGHAFTVDQFKARYRAAFHEELPL